MTASNPDPPAVVQAAALGHTVEPEPDPLTVARCWTCTRCCASVMDYKGKIYGRAIEDSCEDIQAQNRAAGFPARANIDNEMHELPLANRLTEACVREWLDRATAIALATRGNHGTEAAERKAIDEMRHVHLDYYSYTVVPRILNQLRLAGLLKPEVQP